MPNNALTEYFKRRKLRKSLRELRKAAAYRLASDNDILKPEQNGRLRGILDGIKGIDRSDAGAMERFVAENMPEVEAMRPLRGRAAALRNFLDVLAVAFAVAFGVRGLFLQPFKIPTGSMQPTLFGIHYVDRAGLEKYGNPVSKFLIPLTSRRAYLKVERSGEIAREYRPVTEMLINRSTKLSIGGVEYTLPGDFYSNVVRYTDVTKPWYEAGEVLCDGWLSTGDHVFVERLSIHFRGIRRGDVAVFNTENLKSPTQPMGGYYYIKRIAGLPGDTLKIEGRILMIRPKGESVFRRASELDEGFAKTDSMLGGYQGHLPDGLLADGAEITVPEKMFFALGDNTSNSLDGRNWGFIPRRNMIGLAVNVFWPVSRRWGLVDFRGPLKTQTELPGSMALQ